MIDKIIFGQRVRSARQMAKRTQKELGESVGVSENAVHQVECGRNWPSLPSTILMAEELGVSLDFLCARTDTPHLPAKGGEDMSDDTMVGELARLEALLLTAMDLLQAQGSLVIPADWDRHYQAQAQAAARRLGVATEKLPAVPQTVVRRTPR
jgi:transcriptional regulator with XRE-family HTH domain